MHLERDPFRAALLVAAVGQAAVGCGNEPPPPAATVETEQTAGAEPATPGAPIPTAATEAPPANQPATIALSDPEAEAMGPTME